jgi:hypothetical protein
MDSITKVDEVCKAVLSLTDDDIIAVEAMQQEQSSYTHPFKGSSQAKHNANGEYNRRVIAHLKDLRKVLLEGAN